MFAKCYKIHVFSLVLGILFLSAGYICSFLSFPPLEVDVILKIASASCFVVSMVSYYRVMHTLNQVTDITKEQVRMGILTHGITLFALYGFHRHAMFYLLFAASLLTRGFMGITAIDRQMKALCNQLDGELLRIGKDQENRND